MIALHIIFACILVYLCIVCLNKYIILFPNVSYLNFSSLYLSIIFTIVGVCIGALIYRVSLSKKLPSGYKLKDYMTLSIEIIVVTLLISIYVTFIFMENNLEKAIIFVFTVFGMPVFFLMIPVISIFSILKKEGKIFIFSGINLLLFYVFLIVVEGVIYPTVRFGTTNFHEMILFFILFLVSVELGLKILNFDSMIKRITNNKTYSNSILLNGFNRVFNKYILVLSLFILLSYFSTLFFIQADFLSSFGENLGFKIGSIQSVILFTIVAIAITLFFWFYGNEEKKKLNETIEK